MKIFVYGTLKTGYWNNRILKETIYLGDAVVPGYKLTQSGIPFAVPSDGCRVKGEIWDIGEDTKVLDRLDALEGHPHAYFRTPVKTENGDDVNIYVYEKAYDADDCPMNSKGEYFWEH